MQSTWLQTIKNSVQLNDTFQAQTKACDKDIQKEYKWQVYMLLCEKYG